MLTGIALAVSLKGAVAIAAASAPSDALSCQFQRFGKEQQDFDQNGEFFPIIFRFNDPAEDFAKLDSASYSVYDPGRLLEGASSQLELTPSKVRFVASLEQPRDMLMFEAWNPKTAGGTPPAQPRHGDAVWKGILLSRPGNSALGKSYQGWCYYERGVSAASNETLIPRIIKK